MTEQQQDQRSLSVASSQNQRAVATSDVTDRAAERLEALADLAPGYAGALVNLAGEIRAAGNGAECEHGGENWAHRVADVVFGARNV